MGFSEAVGWWNVWQLRILVLGSLFLQYFLCVAAFLRKGRIPDWFRFLTWLAYLGGDAIAIYALATLYNRHQKQEWVSTDHYSVSLEALWAPILLLHLGGQDGITAYNIEDNELWKRHVLTALSQVAVAIYVFCKSWPQDKRLLQAAILIFIPGIVKCMEKPWALKNASINSLVDGTTPSPPSSDEGIRSLEEYVRASSFAAKSPGGHRDLEPPYSLFVDIPPPYSYRLSSLNRLLSDPEGAHDLLQSGLYKTFNRLYSKEQVRPKLFSIGGCICSDKRCFGYLVRTVIVVLTLVAIGLFHKSHREVYSGIDVKVTYILLCCTAALEYITNVLVFNDCSPLQEKKWPDQISQCNLMGYLLACNRRSSFPMVCKDYINQLCCMNMKPCKSSRAITGIVLNHVIENGWKKNIEDVPTYHKFNDSRGQITLETVRCSGGSGVLELELERSLQRPFDESVILWHLATNFCFYPMVGTSKSGGSREEDDPTICMVISNYMAYLLFVNPEMLMAGSRRSLFRVAYGELKDMFNERPSLDGNGKAGSRGLMGDKDLAQKITQKAGLVHDAWVLAEVLMSIGGEEETGQKKMRDVIQGVWVEMLCFSASRCRGFLHAKSLGNGGEYLNYVWLLLSYMGMETLAERLQRTELHAHGDMGTSHPAASAPLVLPIGDNNA
ncbi:uncharacterized protein [Miscanthus floridulus]|uniref:uncharacterized protein n=1 Tax=Miscanthus floridulus TaxID=154761 RepID=UPI003458C40D